jgi:hypothetical protein
MSEVRQQAACNSPGTSPTPVETYSRNQPAGWERGHHVARTIHCTVLEVPAMKDSHGAQPSGYEELMPWADPYIVSLIEKLRGTQEFAEWGDESREDEDAHEVDGDDEPCQRRDPRFNRLRAELPPPSPTDDSRDQRGWQADWSPRNWPRH